ncbi:unnamed protein product [Durusdinium trenchii]|uniref:Uncharacterized protein n=1 Tax=Durusdinium trenchii TaxID=1381693 RepID=A0ABP0PZN9_9DINO
MGAQAASAASICCHVERLPRQQLSVAAAPASGPRPGLLDENFEEFYLELETGGELDQRTWLKAEVPMMSREFRQSCCTVVSGSKSLFHPCRSRGLRSISKSFVAFHTRTYARW